MYNSGASPNGYRLDGPWHDRFSGVSGRRLNVPDIKRPAELLEETLAAIRAVPGCSFHLEPA